MDWVKVLLDKFFVLIVVLIPGGSAILVIALGRPGFWSQFWGLGYLGYQTKVALLVSFAFILGSTANNIIGFIVGYLAGLADRPKNVAGQPDPQPQAPAAEQPWRRQNWRKLLAVYLGDASPEIAPAQAHQESNDALWEEWWEIMHQFTVWREDQRKTMLSNIDFNLGSAGLVLLFSSLGIPALFHWWIIMPCLFWIVVMGVYWLKEYADAKDPEFSYLKQMEYLQMRSCKGASQDDDAQ